MLFFFIIFAKKEHHANLCAINRMPGQNEIFDSKWNWVPSCIFEDRERKGERLPFVIQFIFKVPVITGETFHSESVYCNARLGIFRTLGLF